jgi:hypothetical protein
MSDSAPPSGDPRHDPDGKPVSDPPPRVVVERWLDSGMPVIEIERRLREEGLAPAAITQVMDQALGARVREQLRAPHRKDFWWGICSCLFGLVLVALGLVAALIGNSLAFVWLGLGVGHIGIGIYLLIQSRRS